MKKMIAMALLAIFMGTAAQAQTTKQQLEQIRKERKLIKKASTKELHAKATKEARKEAKRLAKEGWQTSPGALPLEKQIDRSFLMQNEYDDDLFPKYLMAEGQSVGQNYDGAKMQAMELAKQNLAGQIQTEVTYLVENSVANSQLTADEAATVTKSVLAGKNLISQSLGRVLPVVEIYRQAVKKSKTNKNKEVLVRLAYNSEMAKAAAKKAALAGLEQESEELKDKLDKALGW